MSARRVVPAVDVLAKLLLAASLVAVAIDPEWGNLEGKAPVARAVLYPLPAFGPALVWWWRRPARSVPWGADLMLTLVCFSDILGNRMDLYDSVVWFDDLVHLVDTALLSGAVLAVTTTRRTPFVAALERSLAVGITAALAWELFELVSFVTKSSEYPMAYEDTVGDLALGWLGAAVAALVLRPPRRQVARTPSAVCRAERPRHVPVLALGPRTTRTYGRVSTQPAPPSPDQRRPHVAASPTDPEAASPATC